MSLRRAGFVFENISGVMMHGPNTSSQCTRSSARPTRRDGRMVKWRSKLTNHFKERVMKAKSMQGEVLRENVVVPNEMHVFNVESEGSKERGLTYTITISELPRCTCEDFMKREAKKEMYMPCKHIYFVFIRVLGLSDSIHEFIHQAALTKIELFQALHGRRVQT